MRGRGAAVRAAAEALLWLGVASGLLWGIVAVSALRSDPVHDGHDVPAGLAGWAGALSGLLVVASGTALRRTARGRGRTAAAVVALGLVAHGVLASRLGGVGDLQSRWRAVAGCVAAGIALAAVGIAVSTAVSY